MAIGYAHTLFCDRAGCRAKKTIEGTRDAAHAREVARREYGWRTGRRDLCPNETRRATARATSRDGASQ